MPGPGIRVLRYPKSSRRDVEAPIVILPVCCQAVVVRTIDASQSQGLVYKKLFHSLPFQSLLSSSISVSVFLIPRPNHSFANAFLAICCLPFRFSLPCFVHSRTSRPNIKLPSAFLSIFPNVPPIISDPPFALLLLLPPPRVVVASRRLLLPVPPSLA